MIRQSTKNSPTPITDTQMSQLRDASLKMIKLSRSYAMQVGVAKVDEGMLAKTFGIMQVSDSAAYMDAVKNYLAVYEKIAADAKSPALPQYATQTVSLGGKSALAMTVDMKQIMQNVEAQGGADASAMVDRVLRLLFGADGNLTAYVAPVDKQRVLVGYSKSAIEAYIASPPAADNQLIGDDLVQRTLALLPAGSQTVGVISPAGLIAVANAVLGTVPPAQGFQLPAINATPPLGIGSLFSATGYELRIVAPAETLSGIGSLISALRQGPPRGQPQGRQE